MGAKSLENQHKGAGNTNAPVLLADSKALKNLKKWNHFHGEGVEYGHDYSLRTVVKMYVQCGSMVEARQVFDSIRNPDVVTWNTLLFGYADNGQGLTSLDLFVRMRVEGPAPDSVTFVAALKASGRIGCVRQIHNLAREYGHSTNIFVQNTLIYMYAKYCSMADAFQTFKCIQYPTVVSWNALMLGYAENGQGMTALNLFTEMKTGTCPPSSVTFMAALKACSSLALEEGTIIWGRCRNWGKSLHNLAVESFCDSNICLQGTLIEMYGKCGSMLDAHYVFDRMVHPDVVSWNTLILGYADTAEGLTSLELFTRMQCEGPEPDSVTIVAALKACASLAEQEAEECKERGKCIHNLSVEKCQDSDSYVQSTLIDMYAKCGVMLEARHVFHSEKYSNVVSWTAMIMGYADNGQGLIALEMFTRMRSKGPAPNSVTFMAVLKACGLVGGLEFGRAIHLEMEKGYELNVVLVTCLVDFYAKCGSLVEAQSVFDFYAERRNIITWTALLAGFSSCGDHKSVFELFERMQDAGFQPDPFTFLSILTCCSRAGLVDQGKACFAAMSMKYGSIPTLEHYNCMVDIFGRANRLDDAIALLDSMHCSPDDVTWMTLLGACSKWKNVVIGRLAFQSLISLNEKEAAYVLMGQIYGSRGMVQVQEIVKGMRNRFKTGNTKLASI